jgi:hypothetical protein
VRFPIWLTLITAVTHAPEKASKKINHEDTKDTKDFTKIIAQNSFFVKAFVSLVSSWLGSPLLRPYSYAQPVVLQTRVHSLVKLQMSVQICWWRLTSDSVISSQALSDQCVADAGQGGRVKLPCRDRAHGNKCFNTDKQRCLRLTDKKG